MTNKSFDLRLKIAGFLITSVQIIVGVFIFLSVLSIILQSIGNKSSSVVKEQSSSFIKGWDYAEPTLYCVNNLRFIEDSRGQITQVVGEDGKPLKC